MLAAYLAHTYTRKRCFTHDENVRTQGRILPIMSCEISYIRYIANLFFNDFINIYAYKLYYFYI